MKLNQIDVRKQIAQLLSRKKRIRLARLEGPADFNRLGLDLVDVVDLILDVEKTYNITIPDEIPLNSIDDFVHYICPTSFRQAS